MTTASSPKPPRMTVVVLNPPSGLVALAAVVGMDPETVRYEVCGLFSTGITPDDATDGTGEAGPVGDVSYMSDETSEGSVPYPEPT